MVSGQSEDMQREIGYDSTAANRIQTNTYPRERGPPLAHVDRKERRNGESHRTGCEAKFAGRLQYPNLDLFRSAVPLIG